MATPVCLTKNCKMHTSTGLLLVAGFFGLVVAAPPRLIFPQAGGPVAKPIPSSCTVSDPLPTSSPSYLPGPSTSTSLLYSAYYPSPSTDKEALARQCLEQCYGYGDSTECKTAFWAENVVVPAGNRGEGSKLTACLFYTRPLEASDFVPAPDGQATDASAGNIEC